MPHSKRPPIQLGSAIPTPAEFEPTRSWTENGALYRLDVKRNICKRSPLMPGSSVATMFYRVQPAGSKGQTEAADSVAIEHAFVRARANDLLPRQSKSKQDSGTDHHNDSSIDRVAAVALDAQVPAHSGRPTKITRFQIPRLPRRTKLLPMVLVGMAVVALFVIIYPYLPAIQYQFYQHSGANTPQAIQKVTTEREVDGNRLMIPKIGVDTSILEGSSLAVLDSTEGVWHQTGSVDAGNFVLAGHRFKYLPPNTSTLYNLDKLTVGDVIAVDWNGKRNIYKVRAMRTVSANDTSILNPTFSREITVYTCTDKKQTQRTVAVASLVDNP